MAAAIELHNLDVTYSAFTVLAKLSLTVEQGECFGLVGESGSGKSTVLRAIAGLAPVNAGRIVINGSIVGRSRSRALYRAVQMVFQDPYGSLNPRHTVDRELAEPLAIHHIADAERRILRVLDEVGLGSAYRFRYPHQLSGGQRQRVAIARALVLEPSILLLDEPTSALDASVQAEIVNLLQRIQSERKITSLFVSHNLAVVAHLCRRLVVLREGGIVETVASDDLINGQVGHPYTQELLAASEGFSR